MKVLVIIVSYNFEPWLNKCLNSLRASKSPIDVLVVDNNSSDNTIERIQSEYPEVRLIANEKNLGFGAANNIGIKLALQEKYEAVFLLNQDAWIDEITISELSRLSQKYPEIGILSPVHLNGRGDLFDFGFSQYTGLRDMTNLTVLTDCQTVSFINAAFWFIPSHVLRRVGGFCPLFYHYGEDKDYVNRIVFHKLKVGFSPRIFGCHDREYRPVSNDFFFRGEYVYFLSEYANIRYSFTKAFGFGVLAPLKKAMLKTMNSKWKDTLTYIRISTQLLMKTSAVIHYRKLNRQEAPNYIDK